MSTSVRTTSASGLQRLQERAQQVVAPLGGAGLLAGLPAINSPPANTTRPHGKEGWPTAAAMAEHEIAERDRRRIERNLKE